MHEELNPLTERIIGAALEVHHELGPGLLENAYAACLAVELSARGLNVERSIILEIKAVERLERVHSVQLLSYLRFAKCPLGLLFNSTRASSRGTV